MNLLTKHLLQGRTFEELVHENGKALQAICKEKRPRHFKVTRHPYGYTTTNMYPTVIGSKEDRESNLTLEEEARLLKYKEKQKQFKDELFNIFILCLVKK